MSYELLVGLHVIEPKLYDKYRQAMTPLLKKYDGGFRYDFWIEETLKSATVDRMNRVFVIYFKNKETMKLFFNNAEYLQIKNEYYINAVSATTILSEYENKSDIAL